MPIAELDPRPYYRITEQEKKVTRGIMNKRFGMPGAAEEFDDLMQEADERAIKALAEGRTKSARSIIERMHEEDRRKEEVYPLLYTTLQSLFDYFEDNVRHMGQDERPIDFLVLHSVEDPAVRLNLKKQIANVDAGEVRNDFFLLYSFEDLAVGLYTERSDDPNRLSFTVDVSQQGQPITHGAALYADFGCAFIGVLDPINFVLPTESN